MSILAIGLALAITLSEILTKYEGKPLKYILNVYLLLYLVINGLLAYIVYRILPGVASYLLSDDIAQAVQSDSWIRVLIAGLGYALVLRSKLTDIKIGENEIPFGLDIIYQGLSNHLLRGTNRIIKNKEFRIINRIYKNFQDIDTYSETLSFVINNQVTDVNEKNRLSSQIREIKDSQESNYVKCTSLAAILLDIVGSEEEVKSRLNAIPQVEN